MGNVLAFFETDLLSDCIICISDSYALWNKKTHQNHNTFSFPLGLVAGINSLEPEGSICVQKMITPTTTSSVSSLPLSSSQNVSTNPGVINQNQNIIVTQHGTQKLMAFPEEDEEEGVDVPSTVTPATLVAQEVRGSLETIR